MTEKFRSGFVAIIGKPNVGKSTLLNSILNAKVTIVSEKPETTRDNIKGILTTSSSQAIFIDTPGIHRPHLLLGKMMVRKASSTLLDVDLLLFMVELTSGISSKDRLIVDMIRESGKPAIALINKVDARSKSKILPIIAELKSLYDFIDFIPISALNGDNLQILKHEICENLPDKEKYYPDSQITDKDDRFQTSEIIREKVLALTREEVPHSIAVVIDKLSQQAGKEILDIEATIYVERDSQKGIVIGKKGDMAKKISAQSRKDLRDKFGQKVSLRIWVKVLKNWRKDIRSIKRLGMDGP